MKGDVPSAFRDCRALGDRSSHSGKREQEGQKERERKGLYGGLPLRYYYCYGEGFRPRYFLFGLVGETLFGVVGGEGMVRSPPPVGVETILLIFRKSWKTMTGAGPRAMLFFVFDVVFSLLWWYSLPLARPSC